MSGNVGVRMNSRMLDVVVMVRMCSIMMCLNWLMSGLLKRWMMVMLVEKMVSEMVLVFFVKL